MATDAKTGQPIFHGATSVGLRNVGSYQVSGMPWVTGSDNLDSGKVHMVEFPYVTKKITVMNTSPGPPDTSRAILLHFQSGSGAANAITVPGDTGEKTFPADSDIMVGYHFMPVLMSASIDMNVKCTKLYISQLTGEANASYQVLAELTNIPNRRMPHLTGSGITET